MADVQKTRYELPRGADAFRLSASQLHLALNNKKAPFFTFVLPTPDRFVALSARQAGQSESFQRGKMFLQRETRSGRMVPAALTTRAQRPRLLRSSYAVDCEVGGVIVQNPKNSPRKFQAGWCNRWHRPAFAESSPKTALSSRRRAWGCRSPIGKNFKNKLETAQGNS